MSERHLPECSNCHNPVVSTAVVQRDGVTVNRPCGCEFDGDFASAVSFAPRDEASIGQRDDQLADWKRVAGELAALLKDCPAQFAQTDEAFEGEIVKALAAFEAMEKGER